MSQADVFRLEEVMKDAVVLGLAKEYKAYITIRRDLRVAAPICEHAIALRKHLTTTQQLSKEIVDHLLLMRGALMHALVLYARWFCCTSGEPALRPEVFFSAGSLELDTHNQAMSLMGRYLAHEDLDILGVDTIWVNRSAEGAFESTQSDWEAADTAGFDDLKLEAFLRCLYAVHNHIDAKILPDRQQELEANLKRLYPRKSKS